MIDWNVQSTATMRKCLACAAQIPHITFLRATFEGLDYTYCRCTACGSVWHDGAVRDYEAEWPVEGSRSLSEDDFSGGLDVSIEAEANVEGILRDSYALYLGARRPFRQFRYLDVGCGIAWGVDFLASVLNASAVGVEQGIAGLISREVMGVKVVQRLDRSKDPLGGAADAVYLSQVIEHVPDPAGFLRGIRPLLAEGGLIEMSTPNGLVLSPAAGDYWNSALLGHGQHVCVFSPSGLRAALRRMGFDRPDVSIRSADGIDLRASNRPFRATADGRFDLLFQAYLARVDRLDNWHFAIGGGYRLLRHLANRGQWAEAVDVGRRLEARFAASRCAVGGEVETVGSWQEWRRLRIPFCLAGYHYFWGLVELNRQRPADAHHHFGRARLILKQMVRLGYVPNEQRQYFWPAAFHQALSAKLMDRPVDEETEAFRSPGEAANDFDSPPPELLRRVAEL